MIVGLMLNFEQKAKKINCASIYIVTLACL